MKTFATVGLLLLCVARPAVAADVPLTIAGKPIELAVSQVSDRTIRIDLLPLDRVGTPLPDPPSTVLMPMQASEKLRLRSLAEPQSVTIGSCKLTVTPDPLTVTLTRIADGKLVQSLALDADDGSVVFHTDAPVFGLGEGRQQFDRRGFFYDFINGQTTFLATHGATIPVPFLIGTDGWAMFVHNPPPPPPSDATTRRAVEDANRPWVQFDLRGADKAPPPAANTPAKELLEPPATRPTRGRLIPRRDTLGRAPMHIFLSALGQPADALAEFARLTGHATMPPKWVMGYMQSHRSLSGPDQPLQIAKTFREKQLPCDALIYLGSGYTNDKQGQSGWNTGHGSLTFNPRIFPEPQQTLDALHALNFKVVLHKNAAPARLYGNSVNDASDDPLHIHNYWATHEPLMAMGVDAWWPDDGDELPIEARLARHRLYYEGSLKDRPDERPWSLNRNGYASSARYGAWIWSGDVESRWVTLANHIAVGLNYSMSVTPFWGTDTGGFFLARPNEYDGELWTRWFEFSTFTPLFRSHGRNWHLHLPWGWDTGEIGVRESGDNPSNYPPDSDLHNAAVEPICKQYLELRYRLLPYNYTLVREACDTGLPPMRALWLEYPSDPHAVGMSDEYLWGHDLLVAPVVEKAATKRSVYLPAGDWYDWWTGERVAGGQSIARPVDLATMPIYVRAGAIVPLDPVRQFTAQPVTDPTTIRIYPGADRTFTLYDDDGHSQAYVNGTDAKTVWIRFRWADATRTLTIEPDERMTKWPGGVRAFSVEPIDTAGKAQRVEFKGERVEVRF